MVEARRRAILVLGMHRSGTSVLTRLIGCLGAAMPADAIAPHADNALGFWESAGIVRADDALLRAAGSSWFDPRPLDLSRLDAAVLQSCKDQLWAAIGAAFGDAPLFAMKDPRQCRFVPLVIETMREHGTQASAVLASRSPWAIARSLQTRDGTTLDYTQLLWLRHTLDAEKATRTIPRAIVDYDDMLRDWRRSITPLLPLVGRAALPDTPILDEIAALIDPALRHHHGEATMGPSRPALTELISDVIDALRTLCVRDDATVRQAFDAAGERLSSSRWLVDDIIHDELRHRRVHAPLLVSPALVVPAQVSPALMPAEPVPREETDLADAVALIEASGLFDADWYAATYPAFRASGLGPIEHYLTIGAAQGLNPHPLFDTKFYAQQMARRMAVEGGV